MAPPSKVKKRPSQNQIKNTASVVIADATVVAKEANTFETHFVPPQLIRDERSYIDTSSSKAQISAINDTKPRADSVSAINLDAIATQQLLASLASTVPSPKRVRMSVSSVSTRGPESKPSTGSQKASRSAVIEWSILTGAILLTALLVAIFLSMATEGSLLQ